MHLYRLFVIVIAILIVIGIGCGGDQMCQVLQDKNSGGCAA